MGILTRQQGDVFIISSDRATGAAPTTRAPARMVEAYEVWTGMAWSTTKDEAIGFASLEAADEYVRANFGRITA